MERSTTSQIKTMMSENPRGGFGPEKKVEDTVDTVVMDWVLKRIGLRYPDGYGRSIVLARNRKYGLSEQTVEYFQ